MSGGIKRVLLDLDLDLDPGTGGGRLRIRIVEYGKPLALLHVHRQSQRARDTSRKQPGTGKFRPLRPMKHGLTYFAIRILRRPREAAAGDLAYGLQRRALACCRDLVGGVEDFLFRDSHL